MKGTSKRRGCGAAWAAAALLLAAAAGAVAAPQPLPATLNLPKDYKLPGDVSVAVYLPAHARKFRFYLDSAGFWVQPGRSLEQGVRDTLPQFFANAFIAGDGEARGYGLLVALQPEFKFDNGTQVLKFAYRAYDAQGQQLAAGEESNTGKIGDLATGAGQYAAATRVMQQVAAQLVIKLRPDAARFPAVAQFGAVDPHLLIDHKTPVTSGTGFFVNAAGQLLTANHVLQDCTVTEVQHDGQVLSGKVLARSALLDVAVVDTATPQPHFLPLRRGGELVLGEPIVNVGFPLQSLLVATPNLTRGNVSARGALEGSLGQFQFSAPIQPGASGGPVVSDGGELLGIAVGTLNAARLIEKGVLPQNVNFALEARYAAQFMRAHGVEFTEVEPDAHGDSRRGNDAALAAVVRLACYQ